MGPAIALLAAVAIAAAAGVLAWRVARSLIVPRPYGLQSEFTVVGHDPERAVVVLPAPPARPTQFARTAVRGRYGLLWEVPGGLGHGLLGEIVAHGDSWLERQLHVVAGPPPLAGAAARLDVTLHRRDPLADHGVAFEDVVVRGPVGGVPAWWIDRGGDSAVVMVHGRRRGDRTEALRALPAALAAGSSVLITSYRNHDASAASPTGLYTYGQDEADDLLAAVEWLGGRGVRRIALVCYSMGAAVAMVARERWPGGAPELVGIALDSPLVDPRAVARAAVARAGVPFPGVVTELGLAIAALRARARWGPLDLRRKAPGLDVDLLLIGAVDDQTVPIALVDDFAAAAPAERLSYWRVPGAGHVEAFNVEPAEYELRLGGFLGRVLAG